MSLSRAAAASLAAFVLLCSAPAFAQATRTWVSGVGDDANPCSRTAPCKTFAGAISKTTAGGEIDALDPGGFGAITITKAITLDGVFTLAGVLVSGTNGIVVAAGATDVVILRGLDINGLATGLSGIKVTSAGTVHVEKCVIYSFKNKGIEFVPTNTAALFVKDTIIRDNGDSSDPTNANISINTSTAGVTLTGAIDNSKVSGGLNGIVVAGGSGTAAKVTVHNSVITGSATIGVHAEALAEINIERGIVGYHPTGLQADGSGVIRTSNVMIPHNATGVNATAGGTVSSFGNNELNAGNGANGSFTSTLTRQ